MSDTTTIYITPPTSSGDLPGLDSIKRRYYSLAPSDGDLASNPDKPIEIDLRLAHYRQQRDTIRTALQGATGRSQAILEPALADAQERVELCRTFRERFSVALRDYEAAVAAAEHAHKALHENEEPDEAASLLLDLERARAMIRKCHRALATVVETVPRKGASVCPALEKAIRSAEKARVLRRDLTRLESERDEDTVALCEALG